MHHIHPIVAFAKTVSKPQNRSPMSTKLKKEYKNKEQTPSENIEKMHCTPGAQQSSVVKYGLRVDSKR